MNRRPILRSSANFLNAGSASQNYSLVFVEGTTSYLTRTSFSYNHAKFAVSFWFKQLVTGTLDRVFCIKGDGQTANTEWQIRITSAGKIDFITYSGSLLTGRLTTTATYTSLTDFYHLLVHYDSANATAGDRMRLWMDGTEITAFDTDTNPSAAVDDISTDWAIGAENDGGSPCSAIIHQWAMFSDVLPAVTSLRNATTGKPINPVGVSNVFLSYTGKNADVTKEAVQGAAATNNGNVFVTTQVP